MQNNFTFILELDIKDLNEKILAYLEGDIDALEADLLKDKYVKENREINLRLHAKNHKTSMKKTILTLDRAENKLFRHLQQYI